MKKTLFAVFKVFAAVFCLGIFSCASEEDDEIQEYPIESIYGYTYSLTFTASSGTSLSPAITIFNGERLDWNMSTTSMGNNQFYYTAEAAGVNSWLLYWYATKALAEENNKNTASLQARLGIDSPDQISIMVLSTEMGAGSAMGKTPLSMKRTSAQKNTTPTEISGGSGTKAEIEDIEIVPAGDAADWSESSSSYTGSFVFLVGYSDGKYGTTAKGEGSSGDGETAEVLIVKGEGSVVAVKTPKMAYTESMSIDSFEVADVGVTKADGVYYLSKGEFTAETSDGKYSIAGSSLTGKLENGILTLRVVFRPGNMPLPIVQIFTSSSGN